MALDLIAPNFSALAALAGTRVGNLGLPKQTNAADNFMSGLASGLGSMQDRMAAKDKQAQSNQLDQQKLAQQQKQFDASQSLDQQKLDMVKEAQGQKNELEERRIRATEMAKQLEERTKMDQDKLERRGALASAYIVGYENAGSDEEKQQIKDEMLKHAYDSKYIDDTQFTEMDKADPKALYAQSIVDLMVTDKAKDLKAVMSLHGNKNNTISSSSSGTGAAVNAGMQELTKTQASNEQKSISDTLQTIARMKKVGNDYADEYLTYGGKAKGIYGNVASGLPESIKNVLPGAGDSEKFAEGRANFAAQLDQLLTQYVKSMSGVQYGVKELEMHKRSMVNSSDNPAEFKGKYRAMMDAMENSVQIKQDLLSKGMQINSKEFKEQYQKQMQPILEKLKGEDSTGGQESYKYNGKTYTSEQVDAIAKHNGLSREETLKQMGY